VPIDLNQLESIADDLGKDLLRIIKPYLPALGRASREIFDGFIKHMGDANWAEVSKLMYSRMTIPERRKLEEEVYKDAYTAALARFTRKKLTKDIMLRVALSLLTKVLI